MASSEVAGVACEIARTTRYDGPQSPKLPNLRGELRAAKLAAYVSKTLAEAPPLTDEQVTRIALLLKGGDAS